MAQSLRNALRGRGTSDVEIAAVERVFAASMEPRVAQLDDDHHPAYLHPGRSMLVLLHDVTQVDAVVLLIAGLHESVDAALALGPERVSEVAGPSALAALRSIPAPGDERLVERLLGLGPGLALAALAERLDHLRHLHLRDDLMDYWADTHAETVEAWLPFAARTDSTLARRYAHWVRTFAKRLARLP
jgi:hypothetical protein